MKFKFKIQDYQTRAVESVVDVFKGQPYLDMLTFTRDLGLRNENNVITIWGNEVPFLEDDTGFENAGVVLSDSDILSNIQEVQHSNGLEIQSELVNDLGCCSLNIEMETGTGKTYVYIKTIYELNAKYGWSKFIVVVPSVAIREGVCKSFKMTEDHFMEYYGKKIRYFVYDSKNLTRLDEFASSSSIEVMIINMQAFNTEDKAKDEASRRIYRYLDEFQGRRPIDVISSNRPIMILDEPQKMGGFATQRTLRYFNPLFCLNYSATHKKQNNPVYVLDALDAYNEKLVKKIEVKSLEVKNFRGTNSYLYIEKITSDENGLRAKIEFEINYNNSINRETRYVKAGDSLYEMSNDMAQYQGYILSNIDVRDSFVEFINGVKLYVNEGQGDESENYIRRIQIRETIKSHFEKERTLFSKGIKCLSLFFIDEVSKYRDYSKDDNKGEYARIFEEEYKKELDDVLRTEHNSEYVNYLKRFSPSEVHNGYFSIDKRTGNMINPTLKRSEDESSDISAYDLILRNKERLLSFDEPTRFIFSHSALREGWDNPNVFQICTLKHSDNDVSRRQEVGRGLRICVDHNGDRVDTTYPGLTNFFSINKLTVISTGSYADYVKGLQSEMKNDLYNRPEKVSTKLFIGQLDAEGTEITDIMAAFYVNALLFEGYIDKNGNVTSKYYNDKKNNTLPVDLVGQDSEIIYKLVDKVVSGETFNNMIDNASTSRVSNELNQENFAKKEFQQLWSLINHKYTFLVNFNSDELIKHSIDAINDRLHVAKLQYRVESGEQKNKITKEEIQKGNAFTLSTTQTTKEIGATDFGSVKIDLISEVCKHTSLSRKSVVKILTSIAQEKFDMLKNNPEDFIKKVSSIINDEKASVIIEGITYTRTNETFSADIFTENQINISSQKTFESLKSIQKYVVTDGIAENSVEKCFAESLEGATEVVVYAKLPKGFYIPTPLGKHSPDWAIAFQEGTVKHIYFIAETKGTSGLGNVELRPVEQIKTECAKKALESLSDFGVRYDVVNSFDDLMNKVMS